MKRAAKREWSKRGWRVFIGADQQWQVRFRTPLDPSWHNHRVPREHETEAAAIAYAKRWYESLLAELREAPPTLANPVGPATPTIRSLIPDWFDYMNGTVDGRELRPATRLLRQGAIDRHILNSPIADMPLATIGRRPLRAWIRGLREWVSPVTKRPLSSYRIRNIVGTLRAFFADAMAEEWVDLPANPMKHDAVTRLIPEGEPAWGKPIATSRARSSGNRRNVQRGPSMAKVVLSLCGHYGDRAGRSLWSEVGGCRLEFGCGAYLKGLCARHGDGEGRHGTPQDQESSTRVPDTLDDTDSLEGLAFEGVRRIHGPRAT
jgi:hypothetical protein